MKKKRDGDDYIGAVVCVPFFSAIVAHTLVNTIARLTATCSAGPVDELTAANRGRIECSVAPSLLRAQRLAPGDASRMQSAWQRALKHRFVGCNRRCGFNLDFMLPAQGLYRSVVGIAVEGRLHAALL